MNKRIDTKRNLNFLIEENRLIFRRTIKHLQKSMNLIENWFVQIIEDVRNTLNKNFVCDNAKYSFIKKPLVLFNESGDLNLLSQVSKSLTEMESFRIETGKSEEIVLDIMKKYDMNVDINPIEYSFELPLSNLLSEENFKISIRDLPNVFIDIINDIANIDRSIFVSLEENINIK